MLKLGLCSNNKFTVIVFNIQPSKRYFDARFITKCLLHCAIKKRKKQLWSLTKDADVYDKDLAKVLSSIDKCILDNAIKKMFINVLLKPLRYMRKSWEISPKMSHYNLRILKLSIICLMSPYRQKNCSYWNMV